MNLDDELIRFCDGTAAIIDKDRLERNHLASPGPSSAGIAVAFVRGGGSTPTTAGTSGNYETVFYWLRGNGELEKHIGHQVEIEGDLKGDLKEGEVKIDREDRWTEVTVKSNGETMKAKVPHTSVVPSAAGDTTKGRVHVRRVSVEHIKMLAASCEP